MAREVDSLQFLAFMGRIIRAGGIRVGENGDEFELAELVAVHEVIDEAIAHAVDLQRARGSPGRRSGTASGSAVRQHSRDSVRGAQPER